ncbi:MAG TPA: alpha/beta fold hydrolase [Thermoanaerobaculia bacterium]|nr:alpha/beta fold hydrolase [Thermoanaerobaculia bacterium]
MRFEAGDGLDLAGLLYEPKRASQRAVIFLHGTGGASVFESKRTNVLAELFTRGGSAYFAFNNRGAGVMKRYGSEWGGSAYERIRDCEFDIDGAVRMLRRRGYRDLTLIGHSTGANKVAVYDHYKPRNFIKSYVLLAGGDDTGLAFAHLGLRRFTATLAKARAKIKAKRGDELLPAGLSPMEPISWKAWLDMANPDGDYNVFPFLEVMRNVRLSRKPRFRFVRGIRKPALVLYGENDEFCYGDVPRCVDILADAIGPKTNFELAIVKDAGHGFGGFEEELATLIAAWMTR